MSGKVRSMIQGVAVLACIALVCGLLLGAVNYFTYVDPLQPTLDRFASDTGATFPEMTDEDGQEFENGRIVYYARSADGAYDAFLSAGGGGWGGEVQLYVYLQGGAIQKVVLGDNSETLWDTFESDFFDQFTGLDVSSADSFTESDVSTGATASRTIRAVARAIDAVVAYYNANLEGGSNG